MKRREETFGDGSVKLCRAWPVTDSTSVSPTDEGNEALIAAGLPALEREQMDRALKAMIGKVLISPSELSDMMSTEPVPSDADAFVNVPDKLAKYFSPNPGEGETHLARGASSAGRNLLTTL